MTPAPPLRDDVLREVRYILLELGADGERIRPEARIVADLGLDSLELASAIISLEERFAVDLGDAVDETVAVGDVVAAVTVRLRAADAAG